MAGTESRGFARFRRRLSRAAVLALLGSFAAACASRTEPPAAQPAAPPQAAAHPTVRDIVARSAGSVVVVRTPRGLGTGFVVDRGVVATNLHVIAGADRILLATPQGKRLQISAIAGLDPAHDLALLSFAAEASPTPLPLRRDTPLMAGDPVVAIGTPQGLALSASTGIISAVRELGPRLTLVQTTAPISPGSSGGPLLDEQGRVVGVTTLISTSGQNLNFAVPVEYLSALLAHSRGSLSLAEFSKLKWEKETRGGGHGNASGAANRPPFPEAVAGFRMGLHAAEAKATCHSHWTVRGNHAECASAPVEVPFAAGPVHLYFSKDQLIAVELLGSSLDDTRTALVSKYGTPDSAARARSGAEQVEWSLRGGTITVRIGRQRIEILYTSQATNVDANY
jgi:hypothetical protein